MAKNKKYKKKYTTEGRIDMSKGGRVQAQEGGIQLDPETGRAIPRIPTAEDIEQIGRDAVRNMRPPFGGPVTEPSMSPTPAPTRT